MIHIQKQIQRAAKLLKEATHVYITAGAGMGVDSGLPDFRGPEGFWKAYPPFKHLGLRFEEMSTPRWFAVDPHLAWGFFGHRYKLYQETPPHEGHHALKRILDTRNVPYFIFTSNVDGHFAKVFPSERIIEYHGSINHLQCSAPCVDTIWQAHLSEEFPLIVDENIRAKDPIPTCKRCNKPARPNILMFGDNTFLPYRWEEQKEKLDEWLGGMRHAIKRKNGKLVVIEFGAGEAVRTVRMQSEHIAYVNGAALIRVNPRDDHIPRGIQGVEGVSIALGAKEAILAIEEEIKHTT